MAFRGWRTERTAKTSISAYNKVRGVSTLAPPDSTQTLDLSDTSQRVAPLARYPHCQKTSISAPQR